MIFKGKLINKHCSCNVFANLSDEIYFFLVYVMVFLFFKMKLILIYFLKRFKKLSLK